ncbi:MAG: glycosyltransferase [Sediminibacterium sp.]|nr:glycosyltransferase [Sediminibacterium sp.]
MKVICIGNFPPRKCGIATFTENIVSAIQQASKEQSLDIELEVIAMNDPGQTYNYPPIVTKTISDHVKHDYIDAAEYINQSNADLCLLEHEYGIFGGNSGLMLISLLRLLKVPVVTTFHSILEKPNFHQKEVLKKVAAYSSGLIVMSQLAIRFLKEIYKVPAAKIFYVEHGVPNFEQMKLKSPTYPTHWKDKRIMLTFGLIGRSKGIETAIRALPAIVKKYPDFCYVIMGKTHPHVIRHSGEEYRNWLIQLAEELHVLEHIEFINEYVSEEKLVSSLLAADIYVTPYHNKAQITSGTLCYALGGGCAVFSTPYWHAEELLQNGNGILFEFGDHEALANGITEILDEPSKLKLLQQRAYNYGKTIAWPLISNAYIAIFHQLAALAIHHEIHLESQYKLFDHPFNPEHLIRMTDDVGMIQHAHGCTPNYENGYCLDDNSRALLLSMMAYQRFKDPIYIQLAIRYLAFIDHMQHNDGSFNNFMTFSKETLENDRSEDAFGRTIWALGYLVQYAPNDSLFQLGIELFQKSLIQVNLLKHCRGYTNCMLGLYHYIKRFPDQEKYAKLMADLANQLCDEFDKCSTENWHWFETAMTYDNGLLPAALYKAYELIGNDRFLNVANKSTAFLEHKCFKHDYLSLIGNQRWYIMNEDYDLYAQQPIDAMAMVILYDCMYKLNQSKVASDKLQISFKWFLGYNDLDLPLYDTDTFGCNDGIEEFSINRNQGAESTIAYHLAWLIAAPYFEVDKKTTQPVLQFERFLN